MTTHEPRRLRALEDCTMHRINRLFAVALIAAVCALVVPALASAHERRELGEGRYSVIVGFSTEPAFTGFMNGLDLYVYDNSMATPAADGGDVTGAPVEGLESTLQVEIIYGDQTMALPLEARWNSPGEYDAWVVPMAAGDYTFHIFGTINDLAVDETFTSSPEGFGSVTDQSTIQFPQSTSSTGAPVFGTVNGGGIDFGAAGGAAAGLVIGAAGLFLVMRRRNHVASPRLAPVQVGSGD
jgi:hypothetical protein